MNSRISSRGITLERHVVPKVCLTGLMLMGAMGTPLEAQSILAAAQLTGVEIRKSDYAYTLTLENTAGSTSHIQMFWFAWSAGGADYLASEPSSIVTPTGWNYVVEGGGDDDGYSIQFTTFTTPLTPGSSIAFTFHSPDTPKQMAGPASFFPQSPTLTSYVYSAHAADGLQEEFVAQVVLPPSANLGTLTNQISNSNLVLTWAAGTNVVVQQSSHLSPAEWTTVPGTQGVGTFTVTNLSTNQGAFYRLATQ